MKNFHVMLAVKVGWLPDPTDPPGPKPVLLR